MMKTPLSHFVSFLSVLFAVLVFTISVAAAEPGKSRAVTEERAELLAQAVEYYSRQHDEGTVTLDRLVALRRQLLEAREATNSDLKVRAAIVTRELDAVKVLEEKTMKRYEQGMTHRADLLIAKAYRLEVEASLEKIRDGIKRGR